METESRVNSFSKYLIATTVLENVYSVKFSRLEADSSQPVSTNPSVSELDLCLTAVLSELAFQTYETLKPGFVQRLLKSYTEDGTNRHDNQLTHTTVKTLAEDALMCKAIASNKLTRRIWNFRYVEKAARNICDTYQKLKDRCDTEKFETNSEFARPFKKEELKQATLIVAESCQLDEIVKLYFGPTVTNKKIKQILGQRKKLVSNISKTILDYIKERVLEKSYNISLQGLQNICSVFDSQLEPCTITSDSTTTNEITNLLSYNESNNYSNLEAMIIKLISVGRDNDIYESHKAAMTCIDGLKPFIEEAESINILSFQTKYSRTSTDRNEEFEMRRRRLKKFNRYSEPLIETPLCGIAISVDGCKQEAVTKILINSIRLCTINVTLNLGEILEIIIFYQLDIRMYIVKLIRPSATACGNSSDTERIWIQMTFPRSFECNAKAYRTLLKLILFQFPRFIMLCIKLNTTSHLCPLLSDVAKALYPRIFKRKATYFTSECIQALIDIGWNIEGLWGYTAPLVVSDLEDSITRRSLRAYTDVVAYLSTGRAVGKETSNISLLQIDLFLPGASQLVRVIVSWFSLPRATKGILNVCESFSKNIATTPDMYIRLPSYIEPYNFESILTDFTSGFDKQELLNLPPVRAYDWNYCPVCLISLANNGIQIDVEGKMVVKTWIKLLRIKVLKGKQNCARYCLFLLQCFGLRKQAKGNSYFRRPRLGSPATVGATFRDSCERAKLCGHFSETYIYLVKVCSRINCSLSLTQQRCLLHTIEALVHLDRIVPLSNFDTDVPLFCSGRKWLLMQTDRNGRNVLHCSVLCHNNFSDIVELYESIKSFAKLDTKFTKDFLNSRDRFGRATLHYYAKNVAFKVGSSNSNFHDRKKFYFDKLMKAGAQDCLDNFKKTPSDYLIEAQTLYKKLHEFSHLAGDVLVHSEILEQSSGCMLVAFDLTSSKVKSDLSILITNIISYQESESERNLRIYNRTRQFITDLAFAITAVEPLFKSRVSVVGSSHEGTKLGLADEFDFNFELEAFAEVCYPCKTPACPEGYVQLKLKEDLSRGILRDLEEFTDDTHTYLVLEKIKLEFDKILHSALWHKDLWHKDLRGLSSVDVCPLCRVDSAVFSQSRCYTKIRIQLVDEVFPDISIDIVPIIKIMPFWPEQATQFIGQRIKQDGCYFVFDQPYSIHPWLPEGVPYARMSFDSVESDTIRHFPDTAKVAFTLGKYFNTHSVETVSDAETNTLGGTSKLGHLRTSSHVMKTALLHIVKSEAARKQMTHRVSRRGQVSADDSFVQNTLYWSHHLTTYIVEFWKLSYLPSFFMPKLCRPIRHEEIILRQDIVNLTGISVSERMLYDRSISRIVEVQLRKSTKYWTYVFIRGGKDKEGETKELDIYAKPLAFHLGTYRGCDYDLLKLADVENHLIEYYKG